MSSVCESWLCHSVGLRFGPNAAWLSILFMSTSSGLGHARKSLLPSTTCTWVFAAAQALWMRGHFELALFFGSFAVLLVWPFCAMLFIPMGLHALHTRGCIRVLVVALIAVLVFGLIPGIVDSWFYEKPIWPTFEMVAYNALGKSGGGAHLYGVESWTYYAKNLFLNLNIVAPLGMAAAVFGNEKIRLYHGTPLVLACLVFFPMPHKEERFLTPLYPTLCWSAAALLAPSQTQSLKSSKLVVFTVFVFIMLSLSRDLALARLTAPTKIYDSVGVDRVRSSDISMKTLCLGREWYRFPSSFHLPNTVTLKWTRSDFSGLLPQPFAPKSQHGYSRIPPGMNDMNKEEPSRYVSLNQCDYVVDSNEPYSDRDEFRIDGNIWTVVACHEFCDAQHTRQPFRSFALPLNPWYEVQRRQYCLFKKKSSNSS